MNEETTIDESTLEGEQAIGETQPDTSTETVATEPVSETPAIEIPENWEAPLKDYVSGIKDVEGQRAVFDKLKSFDDGYQKKFKDLGTQRTELETQQKAFEDDKHFLDSYRGLEQSMDSNDKATLTARYGSLPNYYNSLLQMDKLASQDPNKFLINYCNANNISRENLEQVLSGTANQQHKQEISQDRFRNDLRKEMEDKFQQQQIQQQLQKFTSAKDEAGGLKHPHFETVRNAMANLEGAYPDKSLEELYDMAVYADPTTRESIMNSQVKAQAENLTNQNEVAKAEKVAGITSTAGSSGHKQNENWRTVLDREIS